MAKDRIDNWYGKPIGDLSRGELIDALDWCVKKLRRYQHEDNRAALYDPPYPVRSAWPYD